jgi:benzoyl-CoA reductase/2-hydroxyglutaryl-CoA dehydratase subunit BcrC/BadD/HgdB
MEKKVKVIMNGLIRKKGLIGMTAKMYVNDEEKARLFIKECRQQTHNESARRYWGEELTKKIEQFCDEE